MPKVNSYYVHDPLRAQDDTGVLQIYKINVNICPSISSTAYMQNNLHGNSGVIPFLFSRFICYSLPLETRVGGPIVICYPIFGSK